MDYFVTCKKCGLEMYCNLKFGQSIGFVCSACASFNFVMLRNIEFKDLPEEEQVYRLRQITKGHKVA